jgi:hypothetical protein
MSGASDINSDFNALLGQEAWSVSRTHGSMFFLEIGEKCVSSYRISGQERTSTHGKWHFLFEMVQWRLEKDGKIVVACEDDQATIDRIFSSVKLGLVDKISVHPVGQDLTISFSSGVSLKTFSNSAQQDDWDQWTLYCPSDRYWSADGHNNLISGVSSEPKPQASS